MATMLGNAQTFSQSTFNALRVITYSANSTAAHPTTPAHPTLPLIGIYYSRNYGGELTSFFFLLLHTGT